MLSFIIKGEIRIFYKKYKLKEFMNTKQTLQEILKRILYTEEERDTQA
jgi:hypothetical protein